MVGMVRCSFSTQELENCSSYMAIQNYDISNCNHYFMPIEWSLVNDHLLSICSNTPWWLPLFTASIILVILQFLGILIVTKYLSKIVDPIIMMKMSQKCSCIAPAWNEDEGEILEPIQKFLKTPSKENLSQTNKTLQRLTRPNLMNLSIKNGYYEIIKIIVNDLQEPVTKKMVMKAFQSKNLRIIKMLLNTAKEHSNNMVRL